MYVPRFWRMQPTRYRLDGFHHADGSASIQQRPVQIHSEKVESQRSDQTVEEPKHEKVSAA